MISLAYFIVRFVKRPLVDGKEAIKCLGPDLQRIFSGKAQNSWSGGVLPKPLSDGTLLCILNPMHSERRNKITLMEEISHSYLKHEPSQLLIMESLHARSHNKFQEEEAYGVGAAALIPWETFFKKLDAGNSVNDLAEFYKVTKDLIEYRIKVTGGYRLYQARQNKWSRDTKTAR